MTQEELFAVVGSLYLEIQVHKRTIAAMAQKIQGLEQKDKKDV